MPARLSKRQQRELEELTHADEIEQSGKSSEDEDERLSVPAQTQSAFAAVSQDDLLEIAERLTQLIKAFKRGRCEYRRGLGSRGAHDPVQREEGESLL
jgi:hypothetical protein